MTSPSVIVCACAERDRPMRIDKASVPAHLCLMPCTGREYVDNGAQKQRTNVRSFHDVALHRRPGVHLRGRARLADAQEAPSGRSEAGEFEKLEPALTFLRARNARDYAVTTPNGIDEATYVKIGGLEQWITIRGEDRKNPVLLLLHGGPGDATNPWGYAGFRNWLKYFTVVQWDQRGAGRTFGRNGAAAASTITIERMVQDGVELAELLSKRLQKDKIVLVGHSWGSTLGVFMAKARPELFHAFVGTGQVADPARNYAVAYAALIEKASREGNARAVEELKAVGPPPYKDGKGFAIQRKWANLFEGADVFLASARGVRANCARVLAGRHQRLVRRTERERRAPRPRDLRARREASRR